jgi:hypothetical protein
MPTVPSRDRYALYWQLPRVILWSAWTLGDSGPRMTNDLIADALVGQWPMGWPAVGISTGGAGRQQIVNQVRAVRSRDAAGFSGGSWSGDLTTKVHDVGLLVRRQHQPDIRAAPIQLVE